MEPSSSFDNLHNFRQAGGEGLKNKHGKKIKTGHLFRSARTDFVTEKERETFHDLGIKSIIDLRAPMEYNAADGDKNLDKSYPPYVLKNGVVKEWQPSRGAQRNNVQTIPESTTTNDNKRRYIVSMITRELISYWFTHINIFFRCIVMVLLPVDLLCGTHFFWTVFTYLVINKMTLATQYLDIMEHSRAVVADILRLVIEEDKAPVLVHCAHGKDRTGIIVAVILGCLEVDDELIALDYAESETGLAPVYDRLCRETVGRYGAKKELTRADAETMREVMREVKKRYGSMSDYLTYAGITLDEQWKLKRIFLEED